MIENGRDSRRASEGRWGLCPGDCLLIHKQDRKERYSAEGTTLRCRFGEMLAVLESEVGLAAEWSTQSWQGDMWQKAQTENAADSVACGREEGSGTQTERQTPKGPESQVQELKPMSKQVRDGWKIGGLLYWWSQSSLRLNGPEVRGKARWAGPGWWRWAGLNWPKSAHDAAEETAWVDLRETSRFLS